MKFIGISDVQIKNDRFKNIYLIRNSYENKINNLILENISLSIIGNRGERMYKLTRGSSFFSLMLGNTTTNTKHLFISVLFLFNLLSRSFSLFS